MEPMQLGNYKLGRQKLLAALRIGSVPQISQGFPRVVQEYIHVTRQTDVTQKLIDKVIMYYICVKTTFFSFIFQS